ncbi:2,5-diamino-6-(ribosylamino)-4(3H)-pyrimidinone 5'-phosphate reductase [Taxawa tesnikishii (nom. ined.)]|nr:2,5-diamino-6-(ribosylamino)-4(3H)-pyrimidinone 5'-phosphate reductase [Dothideales sp. JES 119]
MGDRSVLQFPEEDRIFLQDYLPKDGKRLQDETLPFVTLTFATSLDSALSLAPGTQTALSGPQSKAMTHYLRSKHDAILVGVGTAIADNPSLNCRLDGVGGYGGQGLDGQPQPIVVDPSGRWQLNKETKILNLARDGRGKAPWLITAKTPTAAQLRALHPLGGRVYMLDSESEERAVLSWAEILRTIKAQGVNSVMIEGGGSVINALLSTQNSHLVSSVIVTLAPTWLGQGGVVVSPPRPEGQATQSAPVARLKETKWRQLGDDAVLCGYLNG